MDDVFVGGRHLDLMSGKRAVVRPAHLVMCPNNGIPPVQGLLFLRYMCSWLRV